MSDRGDSAGAAPGSAKDGRALPSASTTKGSTSNLRMSKRNSITGKPSTGDGVILAPANNGAVVATAAETQAPVTNALVYENTYKTKPDRKFQSEPVRKIAEEALEKVLKKAKYDHDKVPELSARIANEILGSVKELEYDRYKVVVDVTIGEFKGQGIRVGSRSLWDTSTDTYASASFKNATLFAVAMVFGCFSE